jgi:hypothetical protein
MLSKSLSIALATAATVANAQTSVYTEVTTGLEGETNKNLEVFNGRGYYTVIQGEGDVPNLVQVSSPTVKSRAKFVAPAAFATSNFGAQGYLADFSVPMALPPTLFGGWYADTGVGTVAVYQNEGKRTSLAQWSQVQTLSPSEVSAPGQFYGAVAVDQATHRKVVVGCSGCNSTTSTSKGQVYLYSASPSGNSWSQSQVLEFSSPGKKRLGYDNKIHDNVLLSRFQYNDNLKIAFAGFVRGPKPEDSFKLEQIFTVPHGDVTNVGVFEETIVLASQTQNIGSLSAAGAVYILYPSKEEFKLKPAGKPRPVQWSVQQVLLAPTPAAGKNFGSYVSIDRNTLAVTSNDGGYVFKREEQSGKWSQQQALTLASADRASVAGSNLAIGSSSAVKFYTLTENWKCLVLSLEDQFGDGWDTAELIVTTPDGTHDYFAQSCEKTNPHQLRYCPNLASDGGLYSFSLPNALKAKFYWELQWGVFEESTATWFRGQWDTKMDFDWDPDTLSFSARKREKVLPSNTTCVRCKTRPTEKPTPALRYLKGSDDKTHTPTVSPAPTLATAVTNNWRYLNLKTTGNPWFEKRYQGTNYYVSDARGHKLIASGTLCEDETTKQCWLDLPDGDYILRVTGALNKKSAPTVNTFSFCKGVEDKETQHQMAFRVVDDDCSIVTFASVAAVCQSLGITQIASMSLVLNVDINLYGTALTTTTSAEHTVFNAALASLFPGLSSSDVTFVSSTPSGSSTLVNANIRISSALGYNLLDFDGEAALEAFLKQTFTSRTKELTMVAALSSGAVASAFSQVSRVEFVDYRIVDSVETLAATDPVDMVTSFADEETVSYEEKTTASSGFVLDGAVVGYLLAGLGLLFMVGFFVIPRTAPQSLPAAAELPTEIESGSRRVNLSEMSTKTLTPKDLRELARMEQEYLKIMEK